MKLFGNAVKSIQLGLNDYSSNDEDRLLSSVRNLHAGILLLYKFKLQKLSPADSNDALIMAKVRPEKAADGKIIWVGHGKTTVDVKQISDRFEWLGIPTDWKRFKKVTDLRNDIEHLYTTLSRDTIRGMIADCFLIIREFMANELDCDPMVELGQDAWETLMSVSEVFEKESQECTARFAKIKWGSPALEGAVDDLSCCNCGSTLLLPLGGNREDGIECRSCGETEDFEALAERALEDALGWMNHSEVMDGGDPVLVRCPHCHHKGYVVEEQACAICGESCTHECSICECAIPVSELGNGKICGYCDYKLGKDD